MTGCEPENNGGAPHSDFTDLLKEGGSPREGYWSPFVVLAWIATRSDIFVTAVQLYEDRYYANRGGPHSISAWAELSDSAELFSGVSFSTAMLELRQCLEADGLKGGIATEMRSGIVREVLRFEWTQWKLDMNLPGISLLPGLLHFKWPSENVRIVFPAKIGRYSALAVGACDRSGGAGRPTSMHLVREEMLRRAGADELFQVLREESEYLSSWLSQTHPSLAQATPKAIRNSLRSDYNELKASRPEIIDMS